MKFFITGAAGFIGFHLSLKLLLDGHHVYGIDNLNDYYSVELKQKRLSKLKEYKNFNFTKIDLVNLHELKKLSYDFAINLAAQAGVRLPKNQYYKYKDSNLTGFEAFLNFCSDNQVKKIIYASSSSVYSGIKNFCYSENEPLETPISEYAKTKIENEKLAKKFSKQTDSRIIGLRFFTVYGPYGRPDMAYYLFSKNVASEKEITLFNSGNTSRDMTYIDDITDGIMGSIRYIENNIFQHEIFNLGNDCPVETNQLLNLIERQFNAKAIRKNIKIMNEVKKTHANIQKSKKLLGYFPKTDIKDGLALFFEWFEDYHSSKPRW